MQGVDLLIFLVDNRGYSYYIDASGNVQVSYGVVSLQYTPMDWQASVIKWARSEGYGLLQRSFSLPLKFVKDAGKIVRYKMYREGCEAVLNMRIYNKNKAFGAGLQHELLYDGPLDFSKFDRQADHVVCNILEGGLDALVKSGENKTFEVDVDAEPDALSIYMDGLEFSKSNTFLIADAEYSGGIMISHMVPIAFLNNEGVSPYILNGSQTILNDFSQYLHENNGPFDNTFPISGTIPFRIENGVTSYQLLILVKKSDNSFITLLDNTIGVAGGNNYSIPFNLSVTLPPGAKLQIIGRMIPNVPPEHLDQVRMRYYPANIYSNFKSRFRATTIKALKGETLCRRLLKLMFGYDAGLISNLLTNLAKGILYTCGDAVRGLAGSRIKTTFSSFFKNIFFLHCAAFGITTNAGAQVPVLEKLTYAYQNVLIANLGEVSVCTDQFADDREYNDIKTGYPNQDYTDVNGRDEFNVTQEYTTPITRVVKVYDITTDYRADAIGIELTRINFAGKTTTDSSSDNDTFVIEVDPVVVVDANTPAPGACRLKRGPYTAISGVISPDTVFNVGLSPKTRLLQHGTVLRSSLTYHTADKIKYLSGDKNADLSYTSNGQTITEGADIDISYWQAPTYLPYYFKITCNPPKNLLQLIGNNPTGYFEWTYKGDSYRGFLIEASFKPAQPDVQEWRLLAMGNNDMTKLI